MTFDRLCGLVVRVPGYRSRCPGSIRSESEKWSGTESTEPREYNWGAEEERVAAPVKKTEITVVGIRRPDHATPLDPLKLAGTSPTRGSRSVGIGRSRAMATSDYYYYLLYS
jgi:hypothetical protein